MEDIQKHMDYAINLIMEYAPMLLLAIITLIVGLSVIKYITKGTTKLMEKMDYHYVRAA